MKRRLPYSLVLVTALIGGCNRDSGGETEVRTPQPIALAGVYSGEFPCSNCAAIVATLWLRPDGRFFLRQQFNDEGAGSEARTGGSPSTTYGLGRWHWDELTAEARLRGAGPERQLTVVDEQHLQLRVSSPTPHVLTRDASAPSLGDRLLLDGESAVTDNGATFTECLTGLPLIVADAGAYRELRRQHRRMNPRGRVALTTVEGHLVTVTDASTTSERLVVDRFITIKPGTGCSP